MSGGETPAAALFHERIAKLNNDVDRLTLRVTSYFRLARHDRSVSGVQSHCHVVIFENVVMDSPTPGIFDVVGASADFTF
jgi:hypothetical protein